MSKNTYIYLLFLFNFVQYAMVGNMNKNCTPDKRPVY